MDDWQRELFQQVETWTQEVSQFWEDMAQDMTETVEAVFKLSDAITEELQESIWQELDQLAAWWMEPLLDPHFSLDWDLQDLGDPRDPATDAFLQEHPVCSECRHYHGHSYGGTLLVCAMHPYGPTEQHHCPDAEPAWVDLN
jgi:hypothetical protein